MKLAEERTLQAFVIGDRVSTSFGEGTVEDFVLGCSNVLLTPYLKVRLDQPSEFLPTQIYIENQSLVQKIDENDKNQFKKS